MSDTKLLAVATALVKKLQFSLEEQLENVRRLPGPVGPRGVKGDKGDKGVKGDRGSDGLRGEKGDKGDTGKQGVTGEKGDKGDKGDRGEKGDKGDRGEPGTKGDRGDAGVKGDRGEPGPKGKDGSPGKAGVKGDKGDRGDKGERGDTGTRGPAGRKGDRGEAGQRGEKGDKGDKGDRGPKGAKGDKGDRGEKGEPGTPGQEGTPGRDVDAEEIKAYFEDFFTQQFGAIEQEFNKRLKALGIGGGGGGSFKILDNADVEYTKLSNVPGKGILIFDENKMKFNVRSIDDFLIEAGADVKYDRLVDEDGVFTYIGDADPGSAKTAAAWRIKRVEDLGGGDQEIIYANGTADFVHIWDDRATLSY